jgi:hypothetical protein
MEYNGMPVSSSELLLMINAALRKSPLSQYVANNIIQIISPFGPPRVLVTKWGGRRPRYPDVVHAMVVSAFDDVELTDAPVIRVVVNRRYKRHRGHWATRPHASNPARVRVPASRQRGRRSRNCSLH